MKETTADRWRNIIVQGWAGMLFLLLLMMLTDLNEFGMRGDFSALVKDPGVGGLWFIVIMACINVLAQISVRTFEHNFFRWMIFGATVIYTLLFVYHQVTHLAPGLVFDFHFAMDLVHHTLGVWASVAAYRWATLSGDSLVLRAISPDKAVVEL